MQRPCLTEILEVDIVLYLGIVSRTIVSVNAPRSSE